MVDYLSLAISHGVLILAFWRLLWRDDLNADAALDHEAEGEPSVSEGPSHRA